MVARTVHHWTLCQRQRRVHAPDEHDTREPLWYVLRQTPLAAATKAALVGELYRQALLHHLHTAGTWHPALQKPARLLLVPCCERRAWRRRALLLQEEQRSPTTASNPAVRKTPSKSEHASRIQTPGPRLPCIDPLGRRSPCRLRNSASFNSLVKNHPPVRHHLDSFSARIRSLRTRCALPLSFEKRPPGVSGGEPPTPPPGGEPHAFRTGAFAF
eukprot:TRINITY_DN9013_c0_g1_i1.p2 TRINITY_DN9013_c0_g1~~TRINITY_DN9013_c0_g1_i1.p2  ORF type:complete len:215 (-),score=15.60 TRINITY_DN9013_c0_g1_i1:88-732(-)